VATFYIVASRGLLRKLRDISSHSAPVYFEGASERL